MNFRSLFLILLVGLSLSCDSDDYPYAKVPSVVLNAFRVGYPGATEAEFSQTGEGYNVDFEVAGNEYSAVITTSGEIVKEKKEISWQQLPAKVQKNLSEKYEPSDIEDQEVVRSAREKYYQAEVRRFFSEEKIVMDSLGKRKEDMNYWK